MTTAKAPAASPPYTLAPSPHTTGEILLTIAPECSINDAVRAANLARSLNARSPGSILRFYMTPAVARRWQMLFDGGWSAVRCASRWGYSKDGRRYGKKRVLAFSRAMAWARREAV